MDCIRPLWLMKEDMHLDSSTPASRVSQKLSRLEREYINLVNVDYGTKAQQVEQLRKSSACHGIVTQIVFATQSNRLAKVHFCQSILTQVSVIPNECHVSVLRPV